MSHYAQTNLQLYAQLLKLKWSERELLCIRKAYDLAVQLFSGHFRGNGKPFLAHLVGTTSILAAHGAQKQIVAAGLLHAVYLQGEFGDGKVGITNPRRSKIIGTVGSEVGKLIAEYTNYAWNYRTIIAILNHIDALSDKQKDLVLMRLANDLEDHLDLGMLYSGKRDRIDKYQRTHLSTIAKIADELGYRELAQEIAEVYNEQNTAKIPEVLISKHTVSYSVAPASHRKRFSLVLASVPRKVYQMLRICS